MPAFLHHKPQLAWSCLLLALLLSPVAPQDPSPGSHPLARHLKRQLPNQTGSTPLAGLLDPTSGANRSVDPAKSTPPADAAASPPPAPAASATPNSPPKDPAASPNSAKDPATSPPNSPPKDPSLSDPLLPALLGSPSPAAAAPSPSPSPVPNTPKGPLPPTPSSSNSTSPSSSTVPPPSPISPSRGQLPTPDPTSASQASQSPSPSPDSQNNRAAKTPPHKDDSSSGFGATTIKLMAIIAGIVAGLFLLWTVIRKWKFSPSKRFAKKLDEYDEDVFAPRPPSFREKRTNDYQAYSIPAPPNTAGPAFGSQYPSYLPERSASPHSAFSPQQKVAYPHDPHAAQAYEAHRLSHASITQPPAMFEPNPYRLSLGLGNIPHAYPPSDQHKPTAL
ncbi:hypothetical protein PtB15_3B896 [Puccinia triticina]|nr:hypothetical protein PtB15_3B896 [Puccinia triticina]